MGTSSAKYTVEEILKLADVNLNGERPSDIRVHDARFYKRVLKDGSLGLGESYMENWWDAPALDHCIYNLLRANLSEKLKPTEKGNPEGKIVQSAGKRSQKFKSDWVSLRNWR
jgi:hypothetical protein